MRSNLEFTLFSNTTPVICTIDAALEVVRVIRSGLALGAELCTVVDFSGMFLALRVYFLSYAVHANNSARHASPRWKHPAILSTLSAIRLVHSCRLYAALKRKRSDLQPVRLSFANYSFRCR